jgi:hypothetical protein
MNKNSKSDKMYSKSPKIEKDKDGKPGIKKPKGDEADQAQTEGSKDTLEGAGDGLPVDPKMQEVVSMHQRHEEEQKALHEVHEKGKKDMHDRHEKDMKDMHTRHQGTNDASASLDSSQSAV